MTISPPTITVIIPALNEEARLGLLLDNLASQTKQPDEVFVIDGGSTDATREIAISNPNVEVKVLKNPHQRVPHGLNIGLAKASSDIVVRIDAHSTINDQYLELIAQNFSENPEAGGVGGVKIAKAETETGKTIAKVLSSKLAVGGSSYHYATEKSEVDHIPFGAYRKSVLKGLGGWDAAILVNQDYELDYRVRQAGHKLLLDPNIKINWHSRETLSQLFHQYHRYGQGKASVIRKHPTSIQPRHLLPAALIITLFMAMVIAISGISFIPLLIPIGYVALLIASTLTMGLRGFGAHVTAVRALTAMQLGYGLGLIRNMVSSLFMEQPSMSGSQTSQLSGQ